VNYLPLFKIILVDDINLGSLLLRNKNQMQTTFFIAGGGGIGRAAALLLENDSTIDATIFLADKSSEQLSNAINWISKAHGYSNVQTLEIKTLDDVELSQCLKKCDVILDCLPGSLAPKLAKLAIEHNCHYANLTEYVRETKEIADMTKDAKTGFVLQTGLAPGYINILARHLYNRFTEDHGAERVDHMQMKVGALSKNALAPSHYAFTWSPIGVATEYVKDAIVVRDNELKVIPALSGRSRITIDGNVYEDNYTSGGAANLPSYYADRIKKIDYKTLRYPGHYKWVEKTLNKIPIAENRVEKLFHIMLEKIPVVEDDFVVIYASVSGWDGNDLFRSYEKSLRVDPLKIGNQKLRAIQSTTAAALCQMAVWLAKTDPSGVIYQTDIAPESFLNGNFVTLAYGRVLEE